MLFVLFCLIFIKAPNLTDIKIQKINSMFILGLTTTNNIKGISFCKVNTIHTFVRVSEVIIAGNQLWTGALVILIIRASRIKTLGLQVFVVLLISMLNILKIITTDAVLCVKKYVMLALYSWLFFLLFSRGINMIEFSSSMAHRMNHCLLDINIINLKV